MSDEWICDATRPSSLVTLELEMLIAGGIGTGLVVGWVAARLLYRARWIVCAVVLLGLIALALLVLRIGSLPAMFGFVAAMFLGAFICISWVRALERRLAAGPLS
jgi:hypothetical protein